MSGARSDGIVIIGAGVAGTAAALALAKAGRNVTLVKGPAGSTQLGPGLLDGPLGPDVRNFIEELDAYVVAEPCQVATAAGVVRPAVGRDRALLDLSAPDLRGSTVLIPRALRQGWDADGLARMLSAAPFAVERALDFRAVDATLLRFSDERTVADAVIADRHDDPARLEWLAERLLAARNEFGATPTARPARAFLLPPWLGTSVERSRALSSEVGVSCGEIAVGLSGPAGFRFAAARDRSLARRGVLAIAGFAHVLRESSDGIEVELESGETLRGSACVIATGGLVGGGLVYDPSDASFATELPNEPRPFVRSSLGHLPIAVRGAAITVPGSLFGVAPETLSWPFVENGDLEQVGVAVDVRGGVRERARVFACGDVVADRPRTWLDAAQGGLDVAAALTHDA